MGEEGTEHRLMALEKSAEKTELALISQSISINKIEKLNIKQDVSLTIIVWLGKAILTVFIGLFVTNIWMYLDKR